MNSAEWVVDEMLRRGIVDTHYHIGPELLPRRYDVATLAALAREHRAAIVLKNHTYATTPLAALARRRFGAELYGGVVLNGFVGGLNPDAVIAAISGNKGDVTSATPDRAPIVVWLPTVHAEAHLRTLGHAFDPRWSGCCAAHHCDTSASDSSAGASLAEAVPCFDSDLQPLPALLDVLSVVASEGCVLATGHLSAAEVRVLVPLALARGVRCVVLTHPHYPCIELSDQDLRELTSDERVFAEHCLAIHTIEEVPLERFVSAIAASPPRQVILSTDFGQVVSAPFPEGTIRYAREMAERLDGIVSGEDIVRMFTANGRALLGLAPAGPA